jgi:hypothetical protein
MKPALGEEGAALAHLRVLDYHDAALEPGCRPLDGAKSEPRLKVHCQCDGCRSFISAPHTPSQLFQYLGYLRGLGVAHLLRRRARLSGSTPASRESLIDALHRQSGVLGEFADQRLELRPVETYRSRLENTRVPLDRGEEGLCFVQDLGVTDFSAPKMPLAFSEVGSVR